MEDFLKLFSSNETSLNFREVTAVWITNNMHCTLVSNAQGLKKQRAVESTLDSRENAPTNVSKKFIEI